MEYFTEKVLLTLITCNSLNNRTIEFSFLYIYTKKELTVNNTIVLVTMSKSLSQKSRFGTFIKKTNT